jgi:hypothetical protein
MVVRDIRLRKQNLFVLIITAGTGLPWPDFFFATAFTAAGSNCSKS